MSFKLKEANFIENIPPTGLSIDFVISQLNGSTKCDEWHQLVKKVGLPFECEIKDLSGKGYLSSINRLRFAFKNGSNFTIILKAPTIDLVGKSFANAQNALSHMVSQLHNKEVYFYTKVADHFRYLETVGPLLPKVYVAKDDKEGLDQAFILMEDLDEKGCTHVDLSQSGLNEKQVESVLVAIAHFHAHSLTLPDDWIQETKWEPELLEALSAYALKGGLLELPEGIGEYFKKHEVALDNYLKEEPVSIHTGQHSRFGIKPVLSHGDLWANNLLYRRSVEKEIGSIMDWQCIHPDTGINDVVHFLLTSVDAPLRRKNQDKWLKIYFNSFSDQLSRDNVKKSPFESVEHLIQIFKVHFPIELRFQMLVHALLIPKNEPIEVQKPWRVLDRQRMLAAFDEIRSNYK